MEDATLTLRADNQNIILDNVGHLVYLDCMRDAKIVCKDGAMRWSALLLSQWSEVVRQNLMSPGFYTADHPLVVILPHVKLATMEAILTCSTKGAVNVTRQQIQETTEVFASLGMRVNSQRGLPGDGVAEKMEEEEMSVRNRDEDNNFLDDADGPNRAGKVKVERSQKTFSAKARKLSDESSPGSNHDGLPDGSRKPCTFKCPLCDFKSHSLRGDSLLSHLCLTHFRRELLAFWGQKNPLAPCLICNQKLFGKEYQNKAHERVNKICMHMGSTHGRIMSLVGEEIKEILIRRRPSLGFSGDDEDWTECLSLVQKANKECNICQNHLKDPQTLKTHLAQVHFSPELLEFFDNENQLVCKICDKQIQENYEGLSFVAINHILKAHVEKLYQAMPQDITRSLKSCLVSNFQLENALKLNLTSGPSNDVKNIEPNVESTPDEQSFPCPLCDIPHRDASRLKQHLCARHYRHDLLNLATLEDIRKCPFCGEYKGTEKSDRNILEHVMVRHIGTVHGGLSKVLPEKIRKRLEKMRVDLSPREKLSTLEESLGSLSPTPKNIKTERLLEDDDDQDVPIRSNSNGRQGSETEVSVFSCPLCDYTSNKAHRVRTHICSTHYRNELLSLVHVEDIRQCPICGVKKGSDKTDRSSLEAGLAAHLGALHNGLVKVLPDELKRKLSELNINIRSKEKLPEEQFKKPKEGRFECPCCISSYDRQHELKSHLSCSHFKQELLNLATIDNIRQCPFCGVIKESKYTDRPKLEWAMASHIGSMHNGLLKVVPDDIKASLAKMKVNLETKERASDLESQLGSMDGTLEQGGDEEQDEDQESRRHSLTEENKTIDQGEDGTHDEDDNEEEEEDDNEEEEEEEDDDGDEYIDLSTDDEMEFTKPGE